MTQVRAISVAADEADIRLDRWFRRRYPSLTHGRLEKLLRTGQIRVDGKRAKANLRLTAGAIVRVPPLSEGAPAKPSVREVSARDKAALAEMVIYKDSDVLALNKPAGLAVQGGTGTAHHLDAMLDGLRFESAERPRLVHRLDKDTSGVLLLARNAFAATRLAEAFREKTARKIYWAAVMGVPRPHSGRIEKSLGKRMGRGGERMMADEENGLTAETLYKLLASWEGRIAWLALWPLTGRTHQLRVHCAAIGTPVLGDRKYGGIGHDSAGHGAGFEVRGLHLHARSIRLPHPRRGMLVIAAPLPDHMAATWERLGFDLQQDAESDDPFPEQEAGKRASRAFHPRGT